MGKTCQKTKSTVGRCTATKPLAPTSHSCAALSCHANRCFALLRFDLLLFHWVSFKWSWPIKGRLQAPLSERRLQAALRIPIFWILSLSAKIHIHLYS